MAIGFIKTLTPAKQFGFIRERETATDYFFHGSEVLPPYVIEDLRVRESVEFEPTLGERGPRATAVRPAASSSQRAA